MKVILTLLGLMLTLSIRATQYDIVTYPYIFVSLSGDAASGFAPVSQTDYNTGQGPNYFAGDRSNAPFTFGFSTGAGDAFYLDYFGFGFTLSDDRNHLYANGSIAQMAFGGGFFSATFSTGTDGITTWNGSYQLGGQTYTASGTGQWLRDGFEPSVARVPETGTTAALLAGAMFALWVLLRWLPIRSPEVKNLPVRPCRPRQASRSDRTTRYGRRGV